jgi:hypothetical protein
MKIKKNTAFVIKKSTEPVLQLRIYQVFKLIKGFFG